MYNNPARNKKEYDLILKTLNYISQCQAPLKYCHAFCFVNERPVFRTLQLYRRKVIKYTASRVEIPITQQLKGIIKDSKKDKVVSPYIVHRRKDPRGKSGQSLTSPTQCRPEDITIYLYSKKEIDP